MSSPEFRELVKIAKILALTNGPVLERELGKVASTPERKKIWVAMDGLRTQQQIAIAAHVNQSAVSRFLDAAIAADIAEYEKTKPPRRKLDYVPPSWAELLSEASETVNETRGSEQAESTLDSVSAANERSGQ